MDKQDLIKYIDRINLTGPGGRDKIKKILMEFAVNGGGGGGGGGDDNPTLGRYVYYGGTENVLPINGSTSNIVNTFNKTTKSITKDVSCTTKYYYISIPIAYTLKSVVTENAEVITGFFNNKGTYLQNGDYYNLYEFHLSSNIPLNTDITITVIE